MGPGGGCDPPGVGGSVSGATEGPPGESDAEGGGLEAEEGGLGAGWAFQEGGRIRGCPDRGTTECCWGVKDRTQNPSLMAEKSLLENTA